MLAVFLARHWLVGITNATLTATLGLGLLRWARALPALKMSVLDLLRLRRVVLLCAILKGALFLLIGVSFHRVTQFPLIFGIQLPDPLDLLFLAPIGRDSVWFPTSASKAVTLLLVGAATFFLIRRALQASRSIRALRDLLHLGSSPEIGGGSLELVVVSRILGRAAAAMGLTDTDPGGLPSIVLAEIPYPTPMLVGLQRPSILIAPRLVQLLSEPELEMALRHELAHFRRRDHWWRWVFSWLEDVGRLNPLSDWLGVLALDSEEELCDRMAIRTPQDALALASAIRKSVAFYGGELPGFTLVADGDIKGGRGLPPMTPSASAVAENEAPVLHSPAGGVQGPAVRQVPPPASASALPVDRGGCLSASRNLILPSQVFPALLGRHTRKWSRTSILRTRLQSLLLAAREVSTRQEVNSWENAAPTRRSSHGARAVVLRKVSRVGFGVLLFLIVYIKFYIVADLFGAKP